MANIGVRINAAPDQVVCFIDNEIAYSSQTTMQGQDIRVDKASFNEGRFSVTKSLFYKVVRIYPFSELSGNGTDVLLCFIPGWPLYSELVVIKEIPQ
jgi:hypothetical protein